MGHVAGGSHILPPKKATGLSPLFGPWKKMWDKWPPIGFLSMLEHPPRLPDRLQLLRISGEILWELRLAGGGKNDNPWHALYLNRSTKTCGTTMKNYENKLVIIEYWYIYILYIYILIILYWYDLCKDMIFHLKTLRQIRGSLHLFSSSVVDMDRAKVDTHAHTRARCIRFDDQ